MCPCAHSFTCYNIDFINCCDVESRIIWKEHIVSVLKIKSFLKIYSNIFLAYILSLSLFNDGEEISFGEKIFDLYVFGLVGNP